MKSKIVTFANRYRKLTGCSQSEAFSYAWAFVREFQNDLFLLTAKSVKGQVSSRVVFQDWNAFNEVKGTGRPTKPGQRLFVDAAKMKAGVPSTISFYESNIITLA